MLITHTTPLLTPLPPLCSHATGYLAHTCAVLLQGHPRYTVTPAACNADTPYPMIMQAQRCTLQEQLSTRQATAVKSLHSFAGHCCQH